MAELALDQFLELSGALELDDLDCDQAPDDGITPTETRLLRYTADPSSTRYMRDLLARYSARDPEVTPS